jgi:hypothetical protein
MNCALLERCGIEIEYMLVERDSLNIDPMADHVLLSLEVDNKGDIDRGELLN